MARLEPVRNIRDVGQSGNDAFDGGMRQCDALDEHQVSAVARDRPQRQREVLVERLVRRHFIGLGIGGPELEHLLLQRRVVPHHHPLLAPALNRKGEHELVVVILIVTGREPTPPVGEPGQLVVAATPWGEVVAITGSAGEIELPADRTTPFVVELPAGDYTIQLRGPDGGDPVELAASVEAGGIERSASTFQTVEAEALLERYGL